MPWSAKAQELLQHAVRRGRGGRRGRRCRGPSPPWSRRRTARRRRAGKARAGRGAVPTRASGHVGRFVAAYRQLLLAGGRRSTDLKLAPFHLLATEGRGPHRQGPRLAHGDAGRRSAGPTRSCCWRRRYQVVDVTDPASEAAGVAWWEELTGRGGEGMVVKPLDFVVRGQARPGPAGGEVPRAASTCGSSTARSTPRRRTSTRLRQRGPGPQAVAGPARVRPGRRGAGAVRPPRAAAARPRVRLRRAGPGERAGRPAAVTRPAGSPRRSSFFGQRADSNVEKVARVGIEPTTPRFSAVCSTD